MISFEDLKATINEDRSVLFSHQLDEELLYASECIAENLCANSKSLVIFLKSDDIESFDISHIKDNITGYETSPPNIHQVYIRILTKLLKNIGFFGTSKFMENLFMNQFKCGLITIIWNIFTEGCHNENLANTFLEIISYIRQHTKNKQWIAVNTKSQYYKTLKTLLKDNFFLLDPVLTNKPITVSETNKSIDCFTSKVNNNFFLNNIGLIDIFLETTENKTFEEEKLWELLQKFSLNVAKKLNNNLLFEASEEITLFLLLYAIIKQLNHSDLKSIFDEYRTLKYPFLKCNYPCIIPKDSYFTQYLIAYHLIHQTNDLNAFSLPHFAKFLTYIATHSDKDFFNVKYFIEIYLKRNSVKEKFRNHTISENDINFTFRSLFYNVQNKISALDFISTFFKSDKEILNILWQMNESVSFLLKANKDKNWNFDSVLGIARKFFDENEIHNALKINNFEYTFNECQDCCNKAQNV